MCIWTTSVLDYYVSFFMDWDIPWFLPLGGGVISVLVLHLMCTTEPSLQLKTQSVSLHSDSRIWKWSGAARRGCIIVVRNARQEGLSEGNQPNTVVYLIPGLLVVSLHYYSAVWCWCCMCLSPHPHACPLQHIKQIMMRILWKTKFKNCNNG